MKKKELVTESGNEAFKQIKLRARMMGMDLHAVALRFALERFLYRVFSKENELLFDPTSETSMSDGGITVKGGMIMCLAEGKSPLDGRSTSDADLHIPSFKGSIEQFKDILKEALKHDPDMMDDGLRFHLEDIKVSKEKDGENTGGTVTIPLQIGDKFLQIKSDVTFDDRPMHLEAPMVLYESAIPTSKHPPVYIRQTPWEYVLADKFCAMATLGTGNYRVKDYNDVHVILSKGLVDIDKAAEILQANAEFKGLTLPTSAAEMGALSDEYVTRQEPRWQRDHTNLKFSAPSSFRDTVNGIIEAMEPILDRVHAHNHPEP